MLKIDREEIQIKSRALTFRLTFSVAIKRYLYSPYRKVQDLPASLTVVSRQPEALTAAKHTLKYTFCLNYV